MSFIEEIKARAAKGKKRIVLPDVTLFRDFKRDGMDQRLASGTLDPYRRRGKDQT